jgi:hypothetical protein
MITSKTAFKFIKWSQANIKSLPRFFHWILEQRDLLKTASKTALAIWFFDPNVLRL